MAGALFIYVVQDGGCVVLFLSYIKAGATCDFCRTRWRVCHVISVVQEDDACVMSFLSYNRCVM